MDWGGKKRWREGDKEGRERRNRYFGKGKKKGDSEKEFVEKFIFIFGVSSF